MEQTPLPPLVGEERFRTFIEEWNGFIDEWERSVEQQCYRILRDRYEADRQRTREVVQALMDAVNRAERCIDGAHAGQHSFLPGQYKDWKLFRHTALSLAKSQMNIEPTKP